MKQEDLSESDESNFEAEVDVHAGPFNIRKRSSSLEGVSNLKRARDSPLRNGSDEAAVSDCHMDTQASDGDLRSDGQHFGVPMDPSMVPDRRDSMESASTMQLLHDIDQFLEPALTLEYENITLRARIQRSRELRLVLETLQAIIDQRVRDVSGINICGISL